MPRILRHLVLVVVGLGAVVWVLTFGAHPTITCRDVVMAPGDVCSNAQGTQVQTYQQRLDAARDARPVIAGAGLAVAGFGAHLCVAELRRAGSSGRTRPDPPPAG